MTLGSSARGTVSAVVSALLHMLVLLGLAATSIQLASEDRQVIPLVIRNPAPPPPPPGGGGPAVAAPAPPMPIEPPKPVVAPARVQQPLTKPKPVEKPKVAAKPRPPARARPTPASAPPAPVAPAPPAERTDMARGGAGGVIGGVAGGRVGGKVGGRLGGSGDDPFTLDEVAIAPAVLEQVRPQYPARARARGLEGVVVVQAIIDRSGTVEGDSLKVIQSQNPFDDAAVAAFRRWRFKPGRDDGGNTVRVIVQQPIRFQLR
jgi:protein TonB